MTARATQTAGRQRGKRGVWQTPEASALQNSRSENGLYQLQRALGNQAMQRSLLTDHWGARPLQRKCASCEAESSDEMAGVIQTKLTVNNPGDVFEQEADRVADAVMSGSPALTAPANGGSSHGRVQRACACGGTSNDFERKTNVVQRVTSTPAATGVATAPPIVHDVLRSPGQPLDQATRAFMEPRLGADFGDVRVHNDSRAAESARAVNALAYTVGNDVVFSAGPSTPWSQSGGRLLAHELTHVLQQRTRGDHGEPATMGASGPSDGQTLQRACYPKGIGHPACPASDPKHEFIDGLLFEFNINCDDFAGGAAEQLSGLAKALRPESKIAIHGYASTDGPKDFNENLACARALKAQSVLEAAGIPESNVTEVVSHGPTPGPAEKRRSVTLVLKTPTPTPKNETGEPREAPSKVDVKTKTPGEDVPGGPSKPPVISVTPSATEDKTPDNSTKQTTPAPPSHLLEFGGETNLKVKRLFRGTPDPTFSTFCRDAEIEAQLHAKLKLDGLSVGDHLHFLYHEPQFSVSVFPFQCGRQSEEKLEVDAVNLEVLSKILEFSLKPGLTLEGTEFKPGLSLEGEWKPWGKNNNFLGHIKITGELESKYETNPITMRRMFTLEGSLGVGLEY